MHLVGLYTYCKMMHTAYVTRTYVCAKSITQTEERSYICGTGFVNQSVELKWSHCNPILEVRHGFLLLKLDRQVRNTTGTCRWIFLHLTRGALGLA